MPIDDRTPNLNLPLPNAANLMTDDVDRMRQAFTTIDTQVAHKAPSSHLTNTENPHSTTAAQVGALANNEVIHADLLPPATASTLGAIKVGSGLSVAPDGTLTNGGSQATFTEVLITPTSNGQTVFPVTGGYSAGFIKVALNGVELTGGGDDYTATNGTSIALTTGINTTDQLKVTRFSQFSVATHVLKSGDAMSGPLVLSGDPTTPLEAAPKQFVEKTAPKSFKVSRSSNTPLAADDRGKIISCTGTWTQTFAAAATLGDGWWCYLKNSGTGDITLDPNSSETIDGLTSYVLYPGETRLVQCDGNAFVTVPLTGGYKIFTATGMFTIPPGSVNLQAVGVSGGGAGAAGASASPSNIGWGGYANGGGGGGTGGAKHYDIQITSASWGQAISAVVGAGGIGSASVTATSGSSSSSNPGGDGGITSLGSFFSITGGKGGGACIAMTFAGNSNVSWNSSTPGDSGYCTAFPAPAAIQPPTAAESVTLALIAGLITGYPVPGRGAIVGGNTAYANASASQIGAGGGGENGYYASGTINQYCGSAAAATTAYGYGRNTVFGLSLTRSGGVGATGGAYNGNNGSPQQHGNVAANTTPGTAGTTATGYGSGGNGGQGVVGVNGNNRASGKGSDGAPGFIAIWWEY